MPAGRPKIKIDKERLHQLGVIGASIEEIASDLGVSHDTLQRNFACELAKARDEGKIGLRHMQYRLAMGYQGEPAEYLKDAKGEYVRDGKGDLVVSKPAVPPRPPDLRALIWLGKNMLKQGDRVIFDEPEEWRFV